MQLSSALLSNGSPKLNAQTRTILHQLQSGQLLTIAPDSPGSLLIVKSFYVDFAGPGAAVGGEFDRRCTAVYVVGTVRLQTIANQSDREDAIQTRLTYAEQLAHIVDYPNPQQRGRAIVQQLAEWLPGNLSLTIPAELTAGLAGVLPTTVQMAWQSHKEIADDISVFNPGFVRMPVAQLA
ncbi:hypothetical protein OsccyDRAFT_2105 [Leptolyngbyaceae cyanobacterium JSC-12]|nr:hypothetical protein OsccyDRAFT_2105 [Leptolyngbyaceae cyanobacterium JSC-12]